MTNPITPLPFHNRHIGPDADDQKEMLKDLGYDSLEELMQAAIPGDIIEDEAVTKLIEPLSEHEAQELLRTYARQNTVLKSFYGQGFNDTITPPVIRRNVVENPAWYTAYTPYQAEISQGRLEALLNFQTLFKDLSSLDLANASLLDEATAVAEAAALMVRSARKANKVVFDERLHRQDLTVAMERARVLDFDVEIADVTSGIAEDGLAGVILAYPGTEGDIVDLRPIIEQVHSVGGYATVVADPLALIHLESPGSLGADIAVGSTQRFGVPLFFGGPHAAYMAVTNKLVRKMPGRIVGVSKDADGNPAYRLTLQTREQHIRRERATSNICTAQALLATMASMYAVWHGPAGLRRIADRIHTYASTFAANIRKAGGDLSVLHDDFFDTVTVGVSGRAEQIVKAAEEAGYLIRHIGDDKVSVAFGESAKDEDITALLEAFGVTREVESEYAEYPESLRRTDDPVPHPIFSSVHSETQMMRYTRRLSDRDLALDRAMIPLGSCTMKLNPAAAMEPITWPKFAGLHPYAPAEQTKGWRAMLEQLENWLVDITGYDKVSLQPNSGAMGELSGLLAIRRYHVANGDHERDICLIPASAHGTNAASAALAGLRVVVIDSNEDGSISVDDLDAKLEKYSNHVAAIMITYPSTHGIYEPTVREVCKKVHDYGGQVYIDGANMNAQCGWSRPGQYGGDVSHLNLHKTFAIPHGGGGPGVGPIAVREHLIPFLPADPLATDPHSPVPEGQGIPMVGTLFGSAGVTPITWMYLAMMGSEGLKRVTAVAVLNANYVAKELDDSFPVLYHGPNGLVGHETIFDIRPVEKLSGVSATDVAKRLMDFGIHAPTLAFPVPGTLMFEPTESESKEELDRFIEAMRTIRAEIQDVIDGKIALEDSVLTNSPFTAASAAADEWNYKFTRKEAVVPVDGLLRDKYYPSVRRIDEAYGDRHLFCECPSPETFSIED